MSHLNRFILLGIAALLGGPVLADDAPQMPAPPSFSDVDANGDQLVTEEEFRSFMEQRMKEREHHRAPPGGRFNPFEKADADGDGALNEQEYNNMMEHMRHMRPPMGPPPGDLTDN
jgi:EF hand